MHDPLEELVRRCTGATKASRAYTIQPLWNGYGELVRLRLEGHWCANVVAKWVTPPRLGPRDVRTAKGRSHARKLRSYAVEVLWYQKYAPTCDASCRVPKLVGQVGGEEKRLFVLEDLEAAGYRSIGHRPRLPEIHAMLRWLAALHATFLGSTAEGLWAIGSYWHLATRQDELTQIRDHSLRALAPRIDAHLNRCTYRTLVHGDAKVDNFCLRDAPNQGLHSELEAAAVDFQYVGRGCGMKDVAYLMSSVWDPSSCAANESATLSYYFEALGSELARRQTNVDVNLLEAEWRSLYPFAWADLQRFYAGWAPGQYDDDPYAHTQVMKVAALLGV